MSEGELQVESVFIENRISILKSKKEQIRGQIIFEINEIIGLSNLGKIQFHRKVEKRFKQKDKTFSQELTNREMFKKLKQF